MSLTKESLNKALSELIEEFKLTQVKLSDPGLAYVGKVPLIKDSVDNGLVLYEAILIISKNTNPDQDKQLTEDKLKKYMFQIEAVKNQIEIMNKYIEMVRENIKVPSKTETIQ